MAEIQPSKCLKPIWLKCSFLVLVMFCWSWLCVCRLVASWLLSFYLLLLLALCLPWLSPHCCPVYVICKQNRAADSLIKVYIIKIESSTGTDLAKQLMINCCGHGLSSVVLITQHNSCYLKIKSKVFINEPANEAPKKSQQSWGSAAAASEKWVLAKWPLPVPSQEPSWLQHRSERGSHIFAFYE